MHMKFVTILHFFSHIIKHGLSHHLYLRMHRTAVTFRV